MPQPQLACYLLALSRVAKLRKLADELQRDCVHCPCHVELLPIIAQVKGQLDQALATLSDFEMPAS
jgi:hypothetical protein